jgi:hypothetical protein
MADKGSIVVTPNGEPIVDFDFDPFNSRMTFTGAGKNG